ncbi:MAG TPA: dienelactone hydrolase family protein [Nitrosopumilaceae archaeon]|nr:dienelactone hydrolase family protein [Nitrosopumilaceae archaeon]
MNKQSDVEINQTPRDGVCTCKDCDHGLVRDCLKTNCKCCKTESHLMILDGMVGMGPVTKRHGRYTEVRSVLVSTDSVKLNADLTIPKGAEGIVLFAHGSGSSRHSPRNKYVAQVLNKAGLATLLIDLLTQKEEKIDDKTAHLRFDIDFLSQRLIGATDWLLKNNETKSLNIGYFGASTGAAAALVAATHYPNVVRAIVSRGGRPDLADPVLHKVKAPTLLIVGGNDYPVIDMNKEAFDKLKTEKKVVIVPGATHLFEEQGTLEVVARLAADWFVIHLAKQSGK